MEAGRLHLLLQHALMLLINAKMLKLRRMIAFSGVLQRSSILSFCVSVIMHK